jgi:membrane protease YdiL (CAAX protease family)
MTDTDSRIAAPTAASGSRVGPAGRRIEFAFFYLGLPILLAFVLPPSAMFPLLFAATLVGIVLLGLTPGFAWRELFRGWHRSDWRLVAGVTAVTAAVSGLLVWWLVPHMALSLPRRAPELWLTIMALYPLLSALPQELVFRPLFFRRYGHLFPAGHSALLANGALFGLAHLMFWNWPAVLLSTAGGLIFAHAYVHRGSFPLAVILHAICGAIIFTSGLGTFFYHGAVR